jgi:hypothetical protein
VEAYRAGVARHPDIGIIWQGPVEPVYHGSAVGLFLFPAVLAVIEGRAEWRRVR